LDACGFAAVNADNENVLSARDDVGPEAETTNADKNDKTRSESNHSRPIVPECPERASQLSRQRQFIPTREGKSNPGHSPARSCPFEDAGKDCPVRPAFRLQG